MWCSTRCVNMPIDRRSALSAALQWAAAGVAVLNAPATWAQTMPSPEVRSALPTATLGGAGRMRFFGLNIYDARLWVTPGFKPGNYAQNALALELNYLRDLSGQAIAERSLKEMRRAGAIAPEQAQRWLEAMQLAFPDVKAGDRITGMHDPQKGASFWFNGQARSAIADQEFSRLFFGIWLSPATSEPALREQLLQGTA